MDFLSSRDKNTSDDLLFATNNLIQQMPKLNNMPYRSSSEDYFPIAEEEALTGGASKLKGKKSSKKKKDTTKKDTKGKKKETKKKQIDTFTKDKLEKIAKRHDVSLKTRDGKIKKKEQLFNSLKRKGLI